MRCVSATRGLIREAGVENLVRYGCMLYNRPTPAADISKSIDDGMEWSFTVSSVVGGSQICQAVAAMVEMPTLFKQFYMAWFSSALESIRSI